MMIPAISSGLNKELNSILDESSKLATESPKLNAADEGTRVTHLQRRIKGLFDRDEFKKYCAADVQGALKKTLDDLESSFHTSSSHPRVICACNAIVDVVRSILFPQQSQTASSSKRRWSQLLPRMITGITNVCRSVFTYLKNSKKPKMQSFIREAFQFRRALENNNCEEVQQLFTEFNIKQNQYSTAAVCATGSPELIAICLQNNFLDLNDHTILERFNSSLVPFHVFRPGPQRSRDDTRRVYKLLTDAGYNFNQRVIFGKNSVFPLERCILHSDHSQIQALVDLGIQVNPDPSDHVSPFVRCCMDHNRGEYLEELLFNGALVSRKEEEELKETGEYREVLLVRQEAWTTLQERNQKTATNDLRVDLDLGEVSRTPALRVQFLQLCREIQADRSYCRVIELQKEFAALMSEYEQLMRKDKSAIVTACIEMLKESTHWEPRDESAPVTELRQRIDKFLKSEAHAVHSKKYYKELDLADANNYLRTAEIHPQSAYWPTSCYRILQGLSRQRDEIFAQRLLLTVRSNHIEEFRHLITLHQIRDKDVLRTLFSEVCGRCINPDFLSILLQRYEIGANIFYGLDFIRMLYFSLFESLEGRGRSLMETHQIFRTLADEGFDLNELGIRGHFIHLLKTLDLRPTELSNLVQELIHLGMHVNPDPEDNVCPFLKPFADKAALETLIFNGAFVLPIIELRSDARLQELLKIRRTALRRMGEMTIASLQNTLEGVPRELMPIFSDYALDLRTISRTPELRELLLKLCKEVQAERAPSLVESERDADEHRLDL